MTAAIFAPGLLHSSAVQNAALVGGLVALVVGPVGVFTVLRGQSFAGHTFGDMSTLGGSGAFLAKVSPLWGLVINNVVAAAVMELIGIQRVRGRDLATGIVLGGGLGLAALFIYLDSTQASTTGVTITVLFGSAFAISGSIVPTAVGLSVLTLLLLAALYRPLLLSSISPELAAARGVPLRLVGFAYLVALAVAVALTALTIGTILSTALLIGPAATALRLTRRPARAMLLAGVLGLGCMWLGILLAYDSFDWSASHDAWPLSFFVVSLVLGLYLVTGWIATGLDRGLGRRLGAASVLGGR